MDASPGSDGMDWEQDSSLHILQPASSPWRKRSFDTYNDTNEPYRADEAYSGYRVIDTLRNHPDPEPVEPFTDFNGRPARYVTDFEGNDILQPIIQRQPRKPIGYYLPELVKWIIYGAALLIFSSCELAGKAYVHTATVAVRVGDSAKRRLVEVTRTTFAPTPHPPPRTHNHNVPPHRRSSPIIRRVSPTSPGGRTHIPVTLPRARPTATLNEAAVKSQECIADYIPSSLEHLRSGAFVAALDDDHLMSGLTHHPYFEALMSGALQDTETDEHTTSNDASSLPIFHIPGTFPDFPAPPTVSPNELPTRKSQASNELAISCDQSDDHSAISDEQAAEEMATPRSEASHEPSIPDVQSTIEIPSKDIDSRPKNYKGELLNIWQIKMCKEFQAIHPPPKEIGQQATSDPGQSQEGISAGLIESHRSPLANLSPTGAAAITAHPHRPTTGLLYKSHGMTTIGLSDLRRSPLELHRAATEVLHRTTSIGSNDLSRSPLADISLIKSGDVSDDSHDATTDISRQPLRTATIGSIDSRRSPLADTSPSNLPHETITTGLIDSRRSPLADTSPSNLPHETITTGLIDSRRSPLADTSPSNSPHETTTTGLIDSPRSPLADTSPSDSPHETTTTGLIDSPRSPLADTSPSDSPHDTNTTALIDSLRSHLAEVSPIHLPPGTSPIGSIDSPRSPLVESPMRVVVDAITDTHDPGANLPNLALGTTPVLVESPLKSPSATMIMMLAESASKWSIRSLYARAHGKSNRRSPLGEGVNNANIHKVAKTPKKVTWPENGPVTGTKRFIKYEAMSHPSPSSSREDSSILSSVPSELSPHPSPIMQEEEEEPTSNPSYQNHPPISTDNARSMSSTSANGSDIVNTVLTSERMDAVHSSDEERTAASSSSNNNEASAQLVETLTKSTAADPSTPPSRPSPKFEELTISTRRSSLRRREKEDKAQKLRDAIAAEERARKDLEEAEEKARKEKEEAEEQARKDKEEAEERARIEAEKEEERKKTGGRRMPVERVIQSLPVGWDEKVRINMAKGMREQLALTSVGNPLTRRDFGMVLPQPGTGDDPSGWLNDEVISAYLQAVVDHGHRAMGHPRGAKPLIHAFSPFFYTTLKERGYDAVKRWSTRAKVGGNNLKSVEYVFIPCNPSKNHWTLVAVSPVRKTIEVFDSLHGSILDKVITTKLWLKGELGSSYVDSEWTVIEDPRYRGRGKGPSQNNGSDCGVFAVTTAKMLVLGVDPMAVSAGDMPLQRRCVVAELLNGGFSGELEPRIVFE